MTDPTLTPAQLALARHALGLPNPRRRSHRNRFLAGAGDEPAWRDMVQLGLAKLGAGTSAGHWFCLTPAGAAGALEPWELLAPEDFPPTAERPLP